MPKQYLPTVGDIERMKKELVDMRGFFPVEGLANFQRTTKDELAVAPRPRRGRELGFVYQKDDLTVTVWTTWVRAWDAARETDSGWLVYELRGRLVYALPIHRTKHFVERLLMEAKIARVRVRLRPECAKCGEPMMIVHGKGLGSRFWRCSKDRVDAPWDTKPFFDSLPPEAVRHLARRRAEHERWLNECRKLGKPIRTAMLRRWRWKKVRLPVTGF